jgi:transporter family-2 protein
MIDRLGLYALALTGGALLTLLISCSSLLAHTTTPIFSSFVAHAGGAVVALVIALIASRFLRHPDAGSAVRGKPPLWMYFGGIAGALTVILPAIAVNGGLSLSATVALSLVGQIVFGMTSDHFGLFGSESRKVSVLDGFVAVLVLAGSIMIIFGKVA